MVTNKEEHSPVVLHVERILDELESECNAEEVEEVRTLCEFGSVFRMLAIFLVLLPIRRG